MQMRDLVRWSAGRGIVGVVAASAMAMSVLVLGPVLLGQVPTHRFLVWNLALAWVPFVAALALERFACRGARIASAASAVVWIAFLPIAPYLVSDMTHYPSADGARCETPARLFWFVSMHRFGRASFCGLLAR